MCNIPKVDLPAGESGKWKVEKFSISESEARFDNMRCAFSPGMGKRAVKAGDYTRLVCGWETIMSDTHAEMVDHYTAVQKAKGYVLINGLGIGMVLNAVLQKPEVEHATVVEIDSDVIALVAPHYVKKFGSRLTIIQADALTFKPAKGIRFGAVWHDIWPHITSDNIPSMKVLHRRYGRCTDWQGSWCRELCEMRR